MGPHKVRRMQRIFGPDGRTLIVAMDHASAIPAPGLEHPGETLRQVVAGGADAIFTTFGIATAYAQALGRTGLILRMDGGVTALGVQTAPRSPWLTVEDALAVGADGVACMALPGSSHEAESLPYAARLAAEAQRWGVPLMIEALPKGFEVGWEAWNTDNVAFAARLAAELGADLVKTAYTGSIEGFQRVVRECYVPVVVLGGERMDSVERLLNIVDEALEAGAAGVAMGRNIWQHPDPERITRALASLIHERWSVQDTLRFLRSE